MKKFMLAFCIILTLCLSCWSNYRPIVKYSPVKLSYAKHQHSSIDEIMLFMEGESIRLEYEVVGWAYVPLKVTQEYYQPGGIYVGEKLKDITQEDAIAALKQEAYKRNADAVINIHYDSEMREVPAFGFLTPKSGGFTGNTKVPAEFIIGTFVIWK